MPNISLSELQKKVELGASGETNVYIKSLETEIPIRELTKKELIELSALATEKVKIDFDSAGNPKVDYDTKQVLESQATVDAKAIIYAVQVDGLQELSPEDILNKWRSKAITELAEAIYRVTGENPNQALRKGKQKVAGGNVGGPFRGQPSDGEENSGVGE